MEDNGLEHSVNSLGKCTIAVSAAHDAAQLRTMPKDLVSLQTVIDAWPKLAESTRSRILEIVGRDAG